MTKKIVSWSSVTSLGAALTLVIAVPASHAEEELPVIESADAAHSDWGESIVDINQIEASEEGGYTTVAWTVENNDDSIIDVTDFWHKTYLYTDNGTSGVALVDSENGIRYNAARDSSGRCVCSGVVNHPKMKWRIKSGESATYWTSYLLSEETEEVTVEVPGFEPVTGVPIE